METKRRKEPRAVAFRAFGGAFVMKKGDLGGEGEGGGIDVFGGCGSSYVWFCG